MRLINFSCSLAKLFHLLVQSAKSVHAWFNGRRVSSILCIYHATFTLRRKNFETEVSLSVNALNVFLPQCVGDI